MYDKLVATLHHWLGPIHLSLVAGKLCAADMCRYCRCGRDRCEQLMICCDMSCLQPHINTHALLLLLWSPYVISQTVIFLPRDFFLSIYLSSFFFFPHLISAIGDWMSTILLHMAWP